MVASLPVLAGVADRPLEDRIGMLAFARAPVLALGGLLIVLVGMFAARVCGWTCAIAATAAAALCPNLIAHSSLATLDLPAAALGALACWLAWSFTRQPSLRRILLFALAMGAAVQVKFTALHLLPALALGAFLVPGKRATRLSPAASLFFAGALGIIGLGLILAVAFPASGGALPFSLDGLLEKWSKGRKGHFSYLLGEWSAVGFPHYFFVALLVKLPLATIVFFLAGLVRLVRERTLEERHAFVAFVVIPAVWILLAMSFVHRVHIGVRHVLPVFPAILAIAGIGWAGLYAQGGMRRAAAIVLAAWLAISTIKALPDPLAYFNEIAGGPRGGERFLIDSNLDWGQDERRLRRHLQDREVAVNPSRPVEGLSAVNVNAIHGVLTRKKRFDWAALLEPVERVGNTWRIVRAEDASMREAGQRGPREALAWAQWLTARGNPEEARRVLALHDLSRHPKLGLTWNERMAEAHLALGDPGTAISFLGEKMDFDLIIEAMFRVSEASGASWRERSPRERNRIFPALVNRGKAAEAEALARRILLESPQDPDALRGLLLSTLALRADQRDPGGPVLASGEVPSSHPFDLFTVPPETLTAEERLIRIGFLMEAQAERRALEEAGALLAQHPANDTALEIFGELVVRRKLGASEYEWPHVDWSNVKR
jgi:hypothetical protein